MSVRTTPHVIPAKAGIQTAAEAARQAWIPAFAGMTGREA